MINWKVRFNNPVFWASLIPLIVLFTQQLGWDIVPENWEAAFKTLLSILTLVGILNDPTTQGLSDSKRAMSYDEPK